MLKIGAQNISGLYVGPEKIKKAYLGELPVFGTGEGPGPSPGPSRLPDGYIEVEYIQSSGYCCINTDIAPTSTLPLKIGMDVEPISNTGNGIFFWSSKVVTSSSNNYQYLYTCYYTASSIKAGMGRYLIGTGGATSKDVITNPECKRMNIFYDMPSLLISVDEAEATFSNRIVVSGVPSIKLLGANSTNYLAARFYSCQIYKGTDFPLVRDFVPCIDPSGAVGLYDLVEGKFYANAGTGTFTAGPAV